MGVNGIYGLSGSGLDIESLVKMGMMNKQKQYDKMFQTQTQQQWLKEAYVGVYDSMKTFKNNMSDFKMQSNMSAMKATSTNNDLVTVTANSAAAAMNHKVSVESVASNAYLMTGDGAKIDRAAGATSSTSTKLSDVIYGSRLTNQGTDADGNTYTVDGTLHKGSDVAISLTLQDSVDDGTGSAKSYKVELTYDDIFESGKTLSDFASAINNAKATKADGSIDENGDTVNIQAGFDIANDSFSLYNKTSGAKNVISLQADNDDTATLLNNLHLAAYDANSNTLGNVQTFTSGTMAKGAAKGTNVQATIDGKTYDLDTHKITVAGVTYTFNGVSEKDASGKFKPTTISVSQDTDKIVDNVKKFVDMYNTLLDDLNSKLSEEKYSDYKPLTKEQEKEMTEDQVKAWNEKAKSGLLYHNSQVRSLVSDMREALYTPVDAVDSKYNSLSAIGITTGKNGVTDVKGHITLDEDKLKKALTEDPDCVYQLFASDQDSSYVPGSTSTNKLSAYEKKSDFKNTGVANRLYNAMTNNMKVFENYAGTSIASDSEANDQSYLGKLITNMQTKMNNFKTMMDSYEKKLYKRYDAMEVALSKLGAQLSYITG